MIEEAAWNQELLPKDRLAALNQLQGRVDRVHSAFPQNKAFLPCGAGRDFNPGRR